AKRKRGRSQLFGNSDPTWGSSRQGPPLPEPLPGSPKIPGAPAGAPSVIGSDGKSVQGPLHVGGGGVPPVRPEPLPPPPLTPAQASPSASEPSTNWAGKRFIEATLSFLHDTRLRTSSFGPTHSRWK